MVKKVSDSAGSYHGKTKEFIGSTMADELNFILGVYRECGKEKTFASYKMKWHQHIRRKHLR